MEEDDLCHQGRAIHSTTTNKSNAGHSLNSYQMKVMQLTHPYLVPLETQSYFEIHCHRSIHCLEMTYMCDVISQSEGNVNAYRSKKASVICIYKIGLKIQKTEKVGEGKRLNWVVIIPVFKLSQSLTMSESHNTYYEFLVLKCNNYWFLKLIGQNATSSLSALCRKSYTRVSNEQLYQCNT